MTSVTFPTTLGGDGTTVTDDSNATTGLGNGGHRYRFVTSLVNLVAMCQTAVTAANTAVTSPASLTATSVTSVLVGTGSKSITLAQTGKGFNVNSYVTITSTATPSTFMYGQITAFNAGTGAMTVNVTSTGGSGTLASWMVNAANPTLSLYSPATGALGLYFDGNNMAFGGTTYPWASTVKALDFGYYGIVANVNSGDFYFGQNTYFNGTNWIAKATGAGALYKQSLGTHTWYAAASVPSGAVQSFVQVLGIDASGNQTPAGAVNFAAPVSLASAATVAIGGAASNNITITGTTTITSFGTAAAGIRRTVTFGGALTLTYNATSMILPGNANITTVADDVAEMVSLGGGNWKCLNYMRDTGLPVMRNGDTLTGALNEAAAVSLASAATVAIGATASNNVTITGTTTITAFDTIASGAVRRVTFASSLILTHNATSLILLGAANIATAAGDVAEFLSLGSGNWRCTVYQKAAGSPLKLDNASVAPSNLSQPFTQGAAVNTTSGTAIDFTGIPSWAKRITVILNGLGTNGTNRPIIQLGISSGVDTTGYSGSVLQTGSALATDTNGASLNPSWASTVRQAGVITITNISGNIWLITGVMGRSDAAAAISLGVTKTLASALDRVRLTTNTGVDTFTAGSINIMYE